MIATLVIGLREGLEAALIVSIIAAFLRANGCSLRPMWIGVGLALALSAAVGVVLDVVERSLPQAGQEGMETVIGAVAIGFVTSMVLWMNRHGRTMRRDLEADAAQALSDGHARALAVMAFLAVLKEGFETAVFLLATFSAAQSAALAAIGAVLGVVLAVLIGCGIYAGGVRINLGRFFRATGAFLILVAAGLVMTTLRTAHEAGWLNAGQHATVDLSWLVTPGSVQSALLTGVLGIQPDPRLVEVVGWFVYLIPVALLVYWPATRRPRGPAAVRLRLTVAGVLALAAGVLALAIPAPRFVDRPAPVTSAAGGGTVRLTDGPGNGARALQIMLRRAVPARHALGRPADHEDHAGVASTRWRLTRTGRSQTTITLDRLVSLAGGRVPVGLDVALDRGPFHAVRTAYDRIDVWVAGGVLLDAAARTTTLLTLSGGGLSGTRTISLGTGGGWHVASDHVQAVASRLATLATDRDEHRFWGIELPLVLVALALVLAVRARRSGARSGDDPAAPDPRLTLSRSRSNSHAIH